MNTKTDMKSTMRMSPRRVYKCDAEQRIMERKYVWKDAFGKYHCTSCGGFVRDITDTITGHDFMEEVLI